MKKKLAFVIVTTMLIGSTLTASAATLKYKPLSEYGYTGVPKITIKLSDSLKEAVNKAVKESLEQNK